MREGFAPTLELRGVTKFFGPVAALHRCDLSAEQGEFLTLLGPSGCGKTTTLMLIAGLEHPSAGHIFLDGVDITDTPPFQRRINTVFQQYALFPHMTVFDNVAFGLRMAGAVRSEISRRVGEQLRLVDLSGFENRYPHQLSGGQQQRVALARALVNEPQILLLDEPLSALDLGLRKQMQLELKRLQQRLEMTFIYVTHDQEEAFTMSDRIAVMNEGRIEQVGSPQEIYEKPRTRFVARFVGETNLLPASLTDPEATESSLVAVRPERIRLATNQERAVAGRVTDTIYTGATIKLVVSVSDWEEPLLVTTPPGTSLARLRRGEEVRLTWDRNDAVHIA